MNHDAAFSVATLGFGERERAMLRDILRLSEHRAPTYRAYAQAPGVWPQLLLVNADAADVAPKLRAFRKAQGRERRCCEIALSTRQVTGVKYVAGRPVAISQLFSLLDRAVMEEHGYRPHAPKWRPPVVLSSQEHASFRVPQPQRSVPATPPRTAAVRAVPVRAAAPALIQGPPLDSAVIMEPVDSNAPTVSVTSIREAVAEARVMSLLERTMPVMASKARILVVDESLPARLQMKAALESFAALIDFADSIEQATRLLDGPRYHLIFVDVALRGQDGLELCRHIRRHPQHNRTPVVLLARTGDAADRAAGKAAGCDAYLVKPVRETVLTEIIGEFIRAPRAA